jgi:hypothetical protein
MYPSYCYQKSGAPIGDLCRFFQWFRLPVHDCTTTRVRTIRYFRTDTPAHCKVTQATIRKLPNPAAIRDALGDAYNACKK